MVDIADLIYLYAAYSIIWVGIFLYIVKLHTAQKKIENELKMLKEILNGKKT